MPYKLSHRKMQQRKYNAARRRRWVVNGLCYTCGKAKRAEVSKCDRCLKIDCGRKHANPEAGAKRRRVQYLRRRKLIDDARSKPCVDCGVEWPSAVMELDHIQGKETIISTSISYARIVAEIAKCEVRCPTCHKLRHYIEWLEQGQS